jgi:hypothetical protein
MEQQAHKLANAAFGDIALVPAPWLKNPKGICNVAEWYMSSISRFDYVYEIPSPMQHCTGEPGKNLRRRLEAASR